MPPIKDESSDVDNNSDTENQSTNDQPTPEDFQKVLQALKNERKVRQEAENRLKENTNTLKSLEEKAKVLEELDVSIEDLKKQSEETKAQKLAEENRVAAQIEVINKLKKEIQDLESNLNKVSSDNIELTISAEIEKAFYRNGGKQEKSKLDSRSYFDFVRDAVRKQVALENGQLIIVDKHGSIRLNPEKNTPMTLDDIMGQVYSDPVYRVAFNEPKASGSGSSDSSGRGLRRGALSWEDSLKQSATSLINQGRK